MPAISGRNVLMQSAQNLEEGLEKAAPPVPSEATPESLAQQPEGEYIVGERVLVRDGDDPWSDGTVVSLEPLFLVRPTDEENHKGFTWDEVRKFDETALKDISMQESLQENGASSQSLPDLQSEPAQALSEVESEPEQSEPEPSKFLNLRDLLNTKWAVTVYPKEDGFMLFKDRVRQAEFTLLDDGSVVWGGDFGGLGTGGQWLLKEDANSAMLEIKRTTGFDIPGIRLPFGRDVWGADAIIDLDEQLNFRLSGFLMSYNAVYPASVIADWNATRLPGRFIRDIKGDDE
jgi:hypothetical protein